MIIYFKFIMQVMIDNETIHITFNPLRVVVVRKGQIFFTRFNQLINDQYISLSLFSFFIINKLLLRAVAAVATY